MSLEIRTITSDEIEAAERISTEAFGGNSRNMTEAVERARRFYQPDWYLGAFEDGEMTSMMRILPFAMRINGRAIPFGAVSPVANSPLHRRKGHTGAMLRHSLELMRERGQWLSGLYTPHPAFYRRYGWEIACDEREYSFKPKDFSATTEPSQRGRLRTIMPDDWHQLDRVYRLHSSARNGPLHRPEVWWRNSTLNEAAIPPGGIPADAVIWETDGGEPQGYVVFTQPTQGEFAGSVVVRELAALSSDAYLNLLTFLAMHDIHREVRIFAPADDPMLVVFGDADKLNVSERYTVLLRIVDVEGALRSRPVADPELRTALTLEVTDASARWNAGTWRVEAGEGAVSAERSPGEGEIRLDARVLATLFNGYIAPSKAAVSGLLHAESDDALRRADAFFRPLHPPYFPDRF
jgi:predicted acetyltransferase